MKIEHVAHWKCHPRSLNAKMNVLKTGNSIRNAYTKACRSMVCWTVVFHEERSTLPFFLIFLFMFLFSPAQKITTVQSMLHFGNSELIPEHKPARQQLPIWYPVPFLLFCWELVRAPAGSSSDLVQLHLQKRIPPSGQSDSLLSHYQRLV